MKRIWTKQQILNMSTSKDIMKALAEHRQLWNEDTSNHLKRIKRIENEARFGDADVLYTPPKRKSP